MCWHYSYPDGYKGQWDIEPHFYLWSVCSFLLNLGREIALSMGNWQELSAYWEQNQIAASVLDYLKYLSTGFLFIMKGSPLLWLFALDPEYITLTQLIRSNFFLGLGWKQFGKRIAYPSSILLITPWKGTVCSQEMGVSHLPSSWHQGSLVNHCIGNMHRGRCDLSLASLTYPIA